MTSTYQTSLALASAEQATPDAAAILARTQDQLGFVPNMYRAMAQGPGLLETYADGYNRFRATSGFSPVEQEVVFLTISRWNQCHYCVAAHSVVADLMSKGPAEVTKALREGRPLPEAVGAFGAAGFDDRQILAVVLGIAVKTISNYTNHLSQTPLDPAFAGRAWQPSAAQPV